MVGLRKAVKQRCRIVPQLSLFLLFLWQDLTIYHGIFVFKLFVLTFWMYDFSYLYLICFINRVFSYIVSSSFINFPRQFFMVLGFLFTIFSIFHKFFDYICIVFLIAVCKVVTIFLCRWSSGNLVAPLQFSEFIVGFV